MLVLCPTDILHQLPLHALKVDGDVLLHRNPVTYIHSHSLLRTSFYAAQSAGNTLTPYNPLFLAEIRSVDNNYYIEGRKNIINLAKRFNSTPLIDDSASKSNFIKKT